MPDVDLKSFEDAMNPSGAGKGQEELEFSTEVDLEDDDAGTEEVEDDDETQALDEGDEGEEEAEEVDPRDSELATLRESLESLRQDHKITERQAQEAALRMQRLGMDGRLPGDPAEEKRKEVLSRKPETVDELMEWISAKSEQDRREITSQSQQLARLEQSVTDARRVYTADAIGRGLDYDSLVSKHISTKEREDSSFRSLIDRMPDPGFARYSLAAIMEAGERAGGDPIETFKAMFDAFGARRNGAKALTDKLRKAQETGAQRVAKKGTNKGKTGKRAVKQGDFSNMTDEQFLEWQRLKGIAS